MFNFTFMNNALVDCNLSDKEFRLLYLIVNNMSMNNTNEIEMYNGFLMDKLNICERQVRRLTSSLVEKGYITKVNTGTKNNRNANVYRLCDTVMDNSGDMMCDISGDKNVPPYNTRKINKNISVYTGTSTRGDKNVQGEVTMNISVQVEDNTNASGNEYEDGTIGDDVDTSIEVKDAGTTPQVKLSKDEIRRRNDYISTVYKRLDTKLDYLYSLRTYSMYVDEVDTIAKIITDAQGHSDWFTSKQWDKLTWYCERFCKITEVKDNYFNGGTKKNADADTISVDDENAGANFNDGSDDSTNDNGGVAPQKCKPFKREDAVAWAEKTLTKFGDFDSWDNGITAKFTAKYGKGWDEGKDPNACRLYNIAASVASDYYWALEDSKDNTPTPTEENADLAPWETPFNYTYTSETPQVAHESISEFEPANYTTDNDEAISTNLTVSDEVEPDAEDYAFDDYISMMTTNRLTTNYGYAYGA